MGENTKIQWADHTFNPWIGCTAVSPACDHCYAERYGKRIGVEWGAKSPRRRTSAANWRLPLRWNEQARIKFDAWEKFEATNPGLTDAELTARGFIKPRRPRVFCASLADVFDNAVPDEWRIQLFALIHNTPYLDWLLLTKRIGNANLMIRVARPDLTQLPNVWLGATVCNQAEADRDIPKLLDVPAAKRFLSIEPMLGPIDLANLAFWTDENGEIGPVDGRDPDIFPDIHWVICGGESGPHARPMHPDWVRSLRDQCNAACVPFFFKQWGEYGPEKTPPVHDAHRWPIGQNEPSGGVWSYRVGKQAAGRLLDGREWNEVPA